MRTVDIAVGARNYSFRIYDGFVGVNVKAHAHVEASMLPDYLRTRFERLPEKTRDMLMNDAWSQAQESWWDNVRDEAPSCVGDIAQNGRSGGYLILREWTESRLHDFGDDAESCGCSKCPDASTFALTADLHDRARDEHSSEQIPLALPRFDTEGWAIPPDAPACVTCGEHYPEHVGYRCPGHLGSNYSPHAYTNGPVEVLNTLEEFLLDVEKRSDLTAVRYDLQHTFTWLVENHFDQEDSLSRDFTAAALES